MPGMHEEAAGRSSEILRCWHARHRDAPLEPLNEAGYLELTPDAETGALLRRPAPTGAASAGA